MSARPRNKFVRVARNIGAVASASGKALSLGITLASLLNVELKHKDWEGSTTPDSSGEVINLTAITQGDGVQNRDGEEIEVKSIQMRGYVIGHASATASITRIIFFTSNQSDGGSIGVTDVLQTANVVSPLNMERASTYWIIEDMVLTTSAAGMDIKHIKYYEKLDQNVHYSGAAAAQANCMEGNIYMLLISNEATNVPTVHYYARIRYVDN